MMKQNDGMILLIPQTIDSEKALQCSGLVLEIITSLTVHPAHLLEEYFVYINIYLMCLWLKIFHAIQYTRYRCSLSIGKRWIELHNAGNHR